MRARGAGEGGGVSGAGVAPQPIELAGERPLALHEPDGGPLLPRLERRKIEAQLPLADPEAPLARGANGCRRRLDRTHLHKGGAVEESALPVAQPLHLGTAARRAAGRCGERVADGGRVDDERQRSDEDARGRLGERSLLLGAPSADGARGVRPAAEALVGRALVGHHNLWHRLGGDVAFLAERAAQAGRVGGGGVAAAVAHDDRHSAHTGGRRQPPRALELPAVRRPWRRAHGAPRLDVALQRRGRLCLRHLFEPPVEEVVLALPEAARGEGAHVPLYAAAHHRDVADPEGRVRLDHLVEQGGGALAPDAAGAVHEHLLARERLLGLLVRKPLWKLAAVAHLWVKQRRPALWRRKVAYRRLVRVPHVDHDRVGLLEQLVVLGRLDVLGG
mmetsp:Transcript_15708/g.52267  ORF Transcript_15708/g.52267 Transcript_15708/m.52267 type:complete len:390 (-) Transcript_15708:513-1682(-)